MFDRLIWVDTIVSRSHKKTPEQKRDMSSETEDNDSLFDDKPYKSSSSYLSDGIEEDDIPHGEVDFLHDVPIEIIAQVGSTQRTLKEILALKRGNTIEFDKVVGEPMDILIGNRLMCRGEIVVVNERYGIRVSEVIRSDDTERELKQK